MIDITNAHDAVARARAYAETHGLSSNLDHKLDYLNNYAGGARTRCRLFPDGAPLSFQFTMDKLTAQGEWVHWFCGGLIYHGSHDGHGSGAAPTFAVTVEPTTGWSIHT